MSTRAKGFLRDKEEFDSVCGAKRPTGELFGAPRNLPSEAMALANALPPPKDQGESEGCVGHGIDVAAETRMRVQGVKVDAASPLAIWTLGRTLAKRTKTERITNTGTYVRLALQGAADFGVPKENDWPLWKAGQLTPDLNTELPPDILQRASAWKLKEQFAVLTEGQSRIDSVCAALVQKYPLPCAGPIDQDFEDYNGQGVLTACAPGKSLGGHMTCIIAYRTNPTTKKREFLIVNSWLNWGMVGQLAWVDEEWIIALDELYAFTLTVGPAGGARTEPAPSEDEPSEPSPFPSIPPVPLAQVSEEDGGSQ